MDAHKNTVVKWESQCFSTTSVYGIKSIPASKLSDFALTIGNPDRHGKLPHAD
jgi:hypothetical protein